MRYLKCTTYMGNCFTPDKIYTVVGEPDFAFITCNHNVLHRLYGLPSAFEEVEPPPQENTDGQS